ncbi:hypothetical protein [Chryseolinea sp. H1M3-3]|uniref:hypothetical protein n=1 Tax=Chryseolinea sp. H1M3-3 TaxID=3034144 RepID=UPI0023ECB693|nr:hypothetical protein [Chryseolinea sp. H1M3-3]
MTKNLFIPVLSLSLIMAFGCSTKNKESGNDHQDHEAMGEDWKEMDDFHMVMAEAFHPYKDSSNLEPAKQNAAELMEAADKWAQAPIPEKFEEDDEVKFKINQLKVDAATFVDVVKAGDDKAIGESLTKLHDLFHELQESWYGSHGEMNHH